MKKYLRLDLLPHLYYVKNDVKKERERLTSFGKQKMGGFPLLIP